MANFKSFISGSLMALALACGSAFAGPSYHVSLDTKAFSGDGILELSFSSKDGAAPATAKLSNFSGAYIGDFDYDGISFSGDGGLSLFSELNGFLWEGVKLGGLFGFDISFDGPDSGNDGARFTVNFLDENDYLLKDAAPFAIFDLTAGADPVFTGSAYARLGDEAANVPEPATMLSILTGLGLLGLVRRRRA